MKLNMKTALIAAALFGAGYYVGTMAPPKLKATKA